MKIFFNELSNEKLEVAEAVLFNGNGHLGMRNTLVEENYSHFSSEQATYINGLFQTSEVTYPERCYGFTPTTETMVNVPDTQELRIYIGGERLSIVESEIIKHERYLDIEKGISHRETIFKNNEGKMTRFYHERLVSFVNKELITEYYEIEPLNHNLEVIVENVIKLKNVFDADANDPRVNHNQTNVDVHNVDLHNGYIKFSAPKSKTNKYLNFAYTEEMLEYNITDEDIILRFKVFDKAFTKQITYSNEQTTPDYNYKEEKLKQEKYLKKFWDDTKVSITSELDLEISVNYGIYALLQSVGRDGETSIAAKGLSGSGYEGHYFWDSEMYILPVFTNLYPEIARDMLKYRISKLDEAIENRKMIGYEAGALYPWRTISGKECSTFFEAGMAQHHINCDIAYGLIDYYEKTGDLELLINGGFDLLYETSVFFESLVYKKDGEYHIDKVTGPDEYTTLVNDNLYTNCMAAYQLRKTAEIYKKNNGKFKKTVSIETIAKFEDIANNIAIKLDKERKIVWQDRDYLNKQLWPYNDEVKRPLLLHYHPLEIYRYQVSKQADAVLAMMLLPDMFDQEYTENSVSYYDQVTTHDSSLSYSIFAIMYARLNQRDKAFKYFMKNAKLDLENTHFNTKDGIHTASMGGTFMTILYGFIQYQIKDGSPSINPNLPKEIKEIKLKVKYKSKTYQIECNHEQSDICLLN